MSVGFQSEMYAVTARFQAHFSLRCERQAVLFGKRGRTQLQYWLFLTQDTPNHSTPLLSWGDHQLLLQQALFIPLLKTWPWLLKRTLNEN